MVNIQMTASTLYVVRNIIDVSRIVRPAIFNMLFTLWAWIEVYGMRTDERLSAIFRNSDNHVSDAMINGVGAIVSLGTVAFGMLALTMFDCRRLVKMWLYASCILMLFVVSGEFFHDVLLAHGVNPDYVPVIVGFCTGLYGIIGCAAFFTTLFPIKVHQFYVLTNCSLVSLFYLRTFPVYTGWVVLALVSVWDIFAVLAPCGPLRLAQEKAGDYGEDVLRFLMFTADNGPSSSSSSDNNKCQSAEPLESEQKRSVLEESNVLDHHGSCVGSSSEESVVEFSMDSSSSSSSSGTDSYSDGECSDSCSEYDDGYEECSRLVTVSLSELFCQPSHGSSSSSSDGGRPKTAADALNDNSSRLGMGDFVFYGVLVGTAAANGSIVATIYAGFGVVFGLFITLTCFNDIDGSVPAIPISVLLGAFFHFTTLYAEKTLTAYFENNSENLFDVGAHFIYSFL